MLNISPGGVLTYLAEPGCAVLMGHFFYKKSLNMGPVFYQRNPCLEHGSTESKFSGFRMAKTPKIAKSPIFQEKSLKMGTLLCQNHP